MKTPMQQVFYRIEQLRFAKNPIDELMKIRLQMLEKEKEVMCEFAFNCGDEIKDQNNWRSPRKRTNYEVILDFYNETFKTKEK